MGESGRDLLQISSAGAEENKPQVKSGCLRPGFDPSTSRTQAQFVIAQREIPCLSSIHIRKPESTLKSVSYHTAPIPPDYPFILTLTCGT
jgi:hypothetical protein